MSSLSSITNILNAEAHEFSPLSIMKIEAARIANEKSGVDKELLRKLHSHEINSWMKVGSPRSRSSSVEWRRSQEYCRFCRSNGATMDSDHVTKTNDGVVQCPILRDYVCPKYADWLVLNNPWVWIIIGAVPRETMPIQWHTVPSTGGGPQKTETVRIQWSPHPWRDIS